ncbi:D-alanyl-D-alanine carboxypeptidase [Arthrobacter sp. Bi26]|uniref:serine hydrolase domain-containing protein n=1 Tax=Arthrobacter sp. Bi26 TaxID=2822350 RepID=UPI001DC5DAD9|nr:serine hydrolase domain-containing protein [Arthrobacter sp. Bi26]CAH0268972.1 D-alanyl-D-alanine carboxypeptidase [Arthrobacter sp. Bi26]
MTQEAIQSATETLERRVQHFMDGGSTSFVVQVRWPGSEWSKAYGVRNLDTKDPAQPEDRVSIASITKSMVAVSVLKLVDQGLIGLDDPVNGVLESFRTTLRPPGPVTVRQLLNHNSGMPDYADAENTDPLKQIVNTRLSMQRGLELAATLPWESKNMDRFAYSNSNYLALGQLIEKLRGRPVADVLKEEIFGSLGLQHTSLAEPDRGAPDNIHAYITDGGERVDVTQPEVFVGSPAAGVISSTQDVNNFFRALLRGQLLSPAMLEEMKKKAGFADYGLGVWRFPDACSGDVRYGHSGTAFGYISISITSADGGSQITMAMTMPPRPWQDPATARRVDLLQTQMEQAAQETLDRLCQ